MKQDYYAAIDIGSNAVRLLIKGRYALDSGDSVTSKEVMLRVPIRLGQDVFTTGRISDEKKRQLLMLIQAYKHVMQIYNITPAHYRACATAALREAENADDVLQAISESTRIRIEIISGEEEARIVYNNVGFMNRHSGNFIYVDVGGGSTEISLISEGELIDTRSFNIGTVRMLNNAVKYSERTDMDLYLRRIAQTHPQLSIVGSGGNINRLFRLSAASTSGVKLFFNAVTLMVMELKVKLSSLIKLSSMRYLSLAVCSARLLSASLIFTVSLKPGLSSSTIFILTSLAPSMAVTHFLTRFLTTLLVVQTAEKESESITMVLTFSPAPNKVITV